MNRTAAAFALALALALAAPVAAFAQEEKPSLDDRFFKAYYQENGLRDFEKAAALYAEVAEAARAAKDPAMEAKALLGRARCLKTRDLREAALDALKAVLALEPGNAEAKGLLVSLEGKPESRDQRLEDRCNTLLNNLQADDYWMDAWREFTLLGAPALPCLEGYLRLRELRPVEMTAGLLASGAIPGGREALLRALADPEVVYSKAVCERILQGVSENTEEGRAAVPAELPLFEAIARRSEPEIRSRVVDRLAGVDLGADPRALTILQALTIDPALEVRLAVIRTGWFASYWKVVAPAVVAALKSASPAERAAAARSIKQDADLLRTVAGDLRGLLNDAAPEVRSAAFETLNEVDGLGQADLADLLGDSAGILVGTAADRLREVSPWEKGVGDAVRSALRKALRAEIPSGGIESVLAFIDAEPRPGGLSVDDLVSLFVQAWAPEQRLGTRAASEVRSRILQALGSRVTGEEEGVRLVLRGLREIGSPDGLLQWVAYWTQENSCRSVEIGIAAAGSPDPRLRAAGYRCLAQCPASTDPRAVTSALARLSEDLIGGDQDLQDAAMAVATVYPDPVSVQAIRKHHAAAQGSQRGALLWTLSKAVGKEAETEVRADLESKDPTVRSTALFVLFGDLGATDFAEIRNYLKSGGTPGEVAKLWTGGIGKRPSLDLLRSFLLEIGTAGSDGDVARAAALLPVEERGAFLKGMLLHPNARWRSHAASLVASWRVMDCVKSLSALLDDPDAGVQAAAAKALEDLNKYLERKAAAARLLDGPAVDPLDAVKALLRSEDPEKRRGAILALGALQDKAAIPLLLKAIEDPDASVRAAALSVLERLGGATR